MCLFSVFPIQSERRNALCAEWLRLGLSELSTSVIANVLCVANHCTKGQGGAWVAKALAEGNVLKGAQIEVLCAALDWVGEKEGMAFTQQCFMGVGTLVRDGFLSGPAVDAYLQGARTRLNSGGHVVANVAAQVEEAVAQFERDGFVLPAALVTRAARHPTLWKSEFLPALLTPQPRTSDYFLQPPERLEPRDRLIHAILLQRQLHMTKAQHEEYMRCCVEHEERRLLDGRGPAEAVPLSAVDTFVSQAKRLWRNPKALGVHLQRLGGSMPSQDAGRACALMAALVLDSGNSADAGLDALLSVVGACPPLVEAVLEGVASLLRDSSVELTPHNLDHMARLTVSLTQQQSPALQKRAQLVWLGLHLGTPRDWVFACRAWLFLMRASTGGAVAHAKVAKRLFFLRLRLAGALEQYRHCTLVDGQETAPDAEQPSVDDVVLLQRWLSEAARLLDQFWSSKVGKDTLASVFQSPPALSDWLRFELAFPIAAGGAGHALALDALGYYQCCMGATSWAASGEPLLPQFVSCLALCESKVVGGVTHTLRLALQIELQRRARGGAEPISVASVVDEKLYRPQRSRSQGLGAGQGGSPPSSSVRSALPLVVLLPLAAPATAAELKLLARFTSKHCRLRSDWYHSPMLLRALLEHLRPHGAADAVESFCSAVPLLFLASFRWRSSAAPLLRATLPASWLESLSGLDSAAELWVVSGQLEALSRVCRKSAVGHYWLGQTLCDDLLQRVACGAVSSSHALECLLVLCAHIDSSGSGSKDSAALRVVAASVTESLARVLENIEADAALFGVTADASLVPFCRQAVACMLTHASAASIAVFRFTRPLLLRVCTFLP